MLRPFKSATIGAFACSEAKWSQDPVRCTEVAGYLYQLIAEHHPYLWPKKGPLRFTTESPQEALYQLFRLFAPLYPKQEMFIARVVDKQRQSSLGVRQLLGYTVTCREYYNIKLDNYLCSTDWWLQWRLKNTRQLHVYSNAVARRYRGQERRRQHLAFLCFAVLCRSGAGFHEDEKRMWHHDNQEYELEILLNRAQQEPKLAHILEWKDRDNAPALVKRLLQSELARHPTGPYAWLDQLMSRYQRFVFHVRREQVDRLEAEGVFPRNNNEEHNDVVGRRARAELYVLHEVLRDAALLADCQGLLCGMPDHSEQRSKGFEGETDYTLADHCLSALLVAVGRLHPDFHQGQAFNIVDFNEEDSEFYDESALPLDRSMEIWCSTYDYVGLDMECQTDDHAQNHGMNPLLWVKPLQPGGTLAEARRNTNAAVPGWPYDFAAAMMALRQAGADYHGRCGFEVKPGTEEACTAAHFDQELSLVEFWNSRTNYYHNKVAERLNDWLTLRLPQRYGHTAAKLANAPALKPGWFAELLEFIVHGPPPPKPSKASAKRALKVAQKAAARQARLTAQSQGRCPGA